jgi:Spy/CpxP family protein refolding chaperone
MKRTLLLAVLVLFSISGIGEAANSGFGSGGSGSGKETMGIPGGKWWRMHQLAEKLALTLEEKEKLDAMDLQLRRQLIDLRSQMQKESLELEQLFNARTFDAAASLDRFKKLQEARTGIALERFKFLLKTRELLGPERFQTLKNEARQYRKSGRLNRRGQVKGTNPRR